MTRTVVFLALATCLLLAGSLVTARHQKGELSGIQGIPVEGHDIAAGIEIVGTKHIDFPRIRQRLRANGADLRLGFPIEGQTLCRFKEVLRDVMIENGFPDAEIRHQGRPTYGNPQHVTLRFTITEGTRSRSGSRAAVLETPAQRCLR